MCLLVVSCVALLFQIGNVSSQAFALLHLFPHKAVISVEVIRCKLWSKCFLWGCCPTFLLCHMNPLITNAVILRIQAVLPHTADQGEQKTH